MAHTILALVQEVADEVGIPRPISVVGSPDDTARRLLAMANREGRGLVEEADWTALQRLHTFDTVADQDEYDLPADYSRLLRDTEWDRHESRPIIGPITPQEWQAIKSGDFGAGLAFRRYRIMRSAGSTARKFRVEPTPGAGEDGQTLAFEYISKHWVSNNDGTVLRAQYAADNDLNLVDDDLLRIGIIVRFKRSVGLEFGSEADEYMQLLRRKKAIDRPSPTINLAQSVRLRLIGIGNLPETGYGGV